MELKGIECYQRVLKGGVGSITEVVFASNGGPYAFGCYAWLLDRQLAHFSFPARKISLSLSRHTAQDAIESNPIRTFSLNPTLPSKCHWHTHIETE